VRLVREPDGTIAVDARARRPGRGAWICADLACVERGMRRERFTHVFRKPCKVLPGLDAAILERSEAPGSEAPVGAARARDAAPRAPVE
jgi:uncharacterized protein